ncbi:MAG: hypothetical protein L0Y73_04655, partial [Candidatus Aminicenantes bacterium]|nr:hypothetical protein [Candidatus Aminicenantes bacterium]
IKEKITGLLKKAAGIALDALQKEYLEALAAAIDSGNFSASRSQWLKQTAHKVDIILAYRPANKSQKYEVYVLLQHEESTAAAVKYMSVLDKMLENIGPREQLAPLDVSVISPIIAADVIFPLKPANYVFVFPGDLAEGDEKRFKIVFFRNVLEAYFKKNVIPLAARTMMKNWADLVDFNSYLSNMIMHRAAHYLGPIFLFQDSDAVTPVKNKLKDLFRCIEEVRAESAALYNTSVLIAEKIITKEQEKNIYAAYLAWLITRFTTNPRSKSTLPALIQLNHHIDNGAIVFDLNTKKLKIEREQLGNSAKKLMQQTAQIENSGNYQEAEKLVAGRLAAVSNELNEVLKNLEKKPRPAIKKKAKPAEKDNR